MQKLINNVNLRNKEILGLKKVMSTCDTYIKFRKPVSIPIVVFEKAEAFDQALSAYNQICSTVSKGKSTKAFIKNRIAIFRL